MFPERALLSPQADTHFTKYQQHHLEPIHRTPNTNQRRQKAAGEDTKPAKTTKITHKSIARKVG